jgi:hypothetical protein
MITDTQFMTQFQFSLTPNHMFQQLIYRLIFHINVVLVMFLTSQVMNLSKTTSVIN